MTSRPAAWDADRPTVVVLSTDADFLPLQVNDLKLPGGVEARGGMTIRSRHEA
jgi:hypothetical protein